MWTTAEVRWFYEGAIPDEVAAWFRQLKGEIMIQPPRTDRYVRPTDAAMNVKLREGRVEVKRRDGSGRLERWTPQIAGQIGRWRKWGFAAQADALDDLGGQRYWIAVTKARRMRSYWVDADGRTEPVRWGDLPARGCDIELSRVTVRDTVWWSLCLEAFGDEESLAERLRRTAQHVFTQGSPPELSAEHSYGYPAWLMNIVDDA